MARARERKTGGAGKAGERPAPDRAAPRRRAPAEASAPAPAKPTARAFVWATPEQAGTLRAAAARAGVTITGAGSGRAGASRALADALGAEPVDDLRHALATVEADVAIIASVAGPMDAEAICDLELCRRCAERGVRIVSLLPSPASLLEAGRAARGAPGAHGGAWPGAIFLPLMRRAPGFDGAQQIIASFGQVGTAQVSARCGAAHGRLSARLFDAMDFVLNIIGEPETIDASVRGARSESGLRLAPGESLLDLCGDMTAHVRFSDGRSASITLSDRAGSWFRGATLIGDAGCLRIDEHDFEWIDSRGALVDSSARAGGPARSKRAGAAGEAGADAGGAAIGADLARLMDPRSPALAPIDVRGVLAAAEAAVLSARTGQPESPDTILRMARAG